MPLFYAYAEANGTVYNGATLSFTTTGAPVVHPTVTTEAATDITLTGATLHKTITADPSEPFHLIWNNVPAYMEGYSSLCVTKPRDRNCSFIALF